MTAWFGCGCCREIAGSAASPGNKSALTKHLPINGIQAAEPYQAASATRWTMLEHAAIGELVDFGTTLAAPYLSELMGDALSIDCSAGGMQSRRAHAQDLQQQFSEPIAAVNQRFSGSFDGRLTLLIPERLSIAVSGGAIFRDGETDPARSAVTQFGDVLATQCLAGLASTLGVDIDVGAPNATEGLPFEVILTDPDAAEDPTFPFALEFHIDGKSAPATLLVSVARPSEEPLKRHIRDFLAIDAADRHSC